MAVVVAAAVVAGSAGPAWADPGFGNMGLGLLLLASVGALVVQVGVALMAGRRLAGLGIIAAALQGLATLALFSGSDASGPAILLLLILPVLVTIALLAAAAKRAPQSPLASMLSALALRSSAYRAVAEPGGGKRAALALVLAVLVSSPFRLLPIGAVVSLLMGDGAGGLPSVVTGALAFDLTSRVVRWMVVLPVVWLLARLLVPDGADFRRLARTLALAAVPAMLVPPLLVLVARYVNANVIALHGSRYVWAVVWPTWAWLAAVTFIALRAALRPTTAAASPRMLAGLTLAAVVAVTWVSRPLVEYQRQAFPYSPDRYAVRF